MVDPLRRGARRAPPSRGLHPTTRSGTSTTRRPTQYPLLPALSVLRPLPQAGGEAGRPRPGPPPAGRRLHARGEGPQLRLLRAADGARLLAVGVHPGGHGGRGRPPRTSPSTTSGRRPSWTCATWRATPGTGCTWPPWPGPGRPWSRGFGGLRDHGGRLCFAPRLPEQFSRLAFGLAVRGGRLRVEITGHDRHLRPPRGRAARAGPPRRGAAGVDRGAGGPSRPAPWSPDLAPRSPGAGSRVAILRVEPTPDEKRFRPGRRPPRWP